MTPEVVITKGSNGLPHHHSDLRGWKPTTVTPWRRYKHVPWKATNGKVRAYIVTATFTGTDLGFDTRDQVLSFVRLACDHTYDAGRIYGGGLDAKGEFLIVGSLPKRHGPNKLVIEACEADEAAA